MHGRLLSVNGLNMDEITKIIATNKYKKIFFARTLKYIIIILYINYNILYIFIFIFYSVAVVLFHKDIMQYTILINDIRTYIIIFHFFFLL